MTHAVGMQLNHREGIFMGGTYLVSVIDGITINGFCSFRDKIVVLLQSASGEHRSLSHIIHPLYTYLYGISI